MAESPTNGGSIENYLLRQRPVAILRETCLESYNTDLPKKAR
jgi:hypothetical protein